MKRLEIRTLRSENFAVRIKHWWKPSERRVARFSLKVMEINVEEFRAEHVRRTRDFLRYGESFEKKTWRP